MGKSGKNEIWSQLLTGGSYWHKVNASELHLARSFQGYLTQPYLGHLYMCTNYAKYAIYGIWGTYFGEQNMVEWGIPEKVLQNAAHIRINRTPCQKSWPYLISTQFLHCNYNVIWQNKK